jgi:heme peroxidase
MFRNLPVYAHHDDELSAIAKSMIAQADAQDTAPVPDPEPPDDDENPLIPAGYTYLGQFIDHDITFDPVSSLQAQNDPDALHDFRTPSLDLDSLYGRGRDDQPYLYYNAPNEDRHPELGFDRRGVMFRLGKLVGDPDQGPVAGPDLPRNDEGRAIIADPRNDENLIVSQLQSVMLRFHNHVVEATWKADNTLSGAALFREAQRRVRWHYQWIVVHDFLPRVVDGDPGDDSTVGRGVVDDILQTKAFRVSGGDSIRLDPQLVLYKWHNAPFMPIEFSVAAYRFGHSMVRPSYFINDVVKLAKNNARVPILSHNHDPQANLNGFRSLPEHFGIDWKFFYDVDPTFKPQHSYKIDTHLSHPLGALPANPDMPSLALRNLKRGNSMSLPSGQTVAKAMGLTPLTEDRLGLTEIAPDYAADAPLWYYILKEAEVCNEGTHLGAVGGRIVAEVILGLLIADPLSYLNVEPNWRPDLGPMPGRFTMSDLINLIVPGG